MLVANLGTSTAPFSRPSSSPSRHAPTSSPPQKQTQPDGQEHAGGAHTPPPATSLEATQAQRERAAATAIQARARGRRALLAHKSVVVERQAQACLAQLLAECIQEHFIPSFLLEVPSPTRACTCNTDMRQRAPPPVSFGWCSFDHTPPVLQVLEAAPDADKNMELDARSRQLDRDAGAVSAHVTSSVVASLAREAARAAIKECVKSYIHGESGRPAGRRWQQEQEPRSAEDSASVVHEELVEEVACAMARQCVLEEVRGHARE